MSVVIETTIGDITVDLYLKERPQTCLNFLKLCKMKYYNLCLFYKIEKNFIAQTGDPTATGRGGESVFCHLYGDQAKYFESECKPRLKHEKIGTLSMVNNGNNMNGSQFFLTLSDNLTYLDENHTVFGEIAEGLDVLLKLNDTICDNNNRPYQDIRITHTVILHDPFEDPSGFEVPDASPEPTKEMLESNYIGADEEIDDNKGKTAEEIEEKIKESEARARATILEMVGDIPEADVKPPENVLFVCKLNPVTTSEDLEVIFSRFGTILSCEVIKDKKTGESLQYAFIEFEKEEDCENAYFKMDNVLIDDRRIHVDFSQSVSKMNWSKDNISNMKGSRFQNIVLKNSSKKSDGYDLIFDMDDDNVTPRDGKAQRSKSKTSDHEKSASSSRYRNVSSKNKTSSPSHSEERKRRREEKDHSNYYDRWHKDRKYDKYRTDKEQRHRYREHEYSVSTDRGRDYNQHRIQTSRYSVKSSSRGNRNYEQYRKSSPEFNNPYKLSEKKRRYDSVSPDRQKQKSYNRHREQSSCGNSDRTKYSDKSNCDDVKKNKTSKTSYKDSKKDKIELSSHKSKDAIEKSRSSNKRKTKVSSRSSSVSSSSSSTSSSSSSSSKHKSRSKKKDTSSSESDSSSSSSSSGTKRNKKKSKHEKRKEISNFSSRKKTKSHKRGKYSS